MRFSLPRRRILQCCMFCRRLMWLRLERYCDRCYQRARTLAAELDKDNGA